MRPGFTLQGSGDFPHLRAGCSALDGPRLDLYVGKLLQRASCRSGYRTPTRAPAGRSDVDTVGQPTSGVPPAQLCSPRPGPMGTRRDVSTEVSASPRPRRRVLGFKGSPTLGAGTKELCSARWKGAPLRKHSWGSHRDAFDEKPLHPGPPCPGGTRRPREPREDPLFSRVVF